MILKKIFFLLACSLVGHMHGQMTHEQFLVEEKNTSAGRLSPENEAFIKKIMTQLNITTPIEIRQPVKSLIEVAPIYQFESYVAASNIWYINEAWLNKLSLEQRTYLVGYRLLVIKSTAATRINQMNFITIGATTAFTILFLLGSYKFIRPYPTVLGFNNSKMKSFLLPYAVLSGLSHGIIEPMRKRFMERYLQNIALQADAEAVKQLDCLDGAISELALLEKNLAPMYIADKAYWKGLYESLLPRIAALQKMKTGNK